LDFSKKESAQQMKELTIPGEVGMIELQAVRNVK
jgi:hypothetical protein